jgi:acetoin utilization protein AcuB
MTTFPFTIEAGAAVLEARKLMLRHKVRHLPVVRDGELAGLISDRDLKLMLGPEFDYPNPREVSVADVMVEQPYVVDLDTPLVRVLRHMAEARIGTALVTRGGALAGIFTAMDACLYLAERLEEEAADAGSGIPYPHDHEPDLQ